jgi:hypothetical protein
MSHPALRYAADVNKVISRGLSREKRSQLSIWILQGHPFLPGLIEKQVADQLAVFIAPYLTEVDRWEWLYPSALKADAKLFSQLTVLCKSEGRSILLAESMRRLYAVHSDRSEYPSHADFCRVISANREMWGIAADRRPDVADKSDRKSLPTHSIRVRAPTASPTCGTNFLVPEKPRSFSGAARVEKGVPKGPDFFLHRSECPVHVEVLKKHTHVVAFRVGPRNLVHALQPIPHQLRLAQLINHRVLALSEPFLSIFSHRHLPKPWSPPLPRV